MGVNASRSHINTEDTLYLWVGGLLDQNLLGDPLPVVLLENDHVVTQHPARAASTPNRDITGNSYSSA